MSLKKHFDNTQKISDTEFMNQQISRLITEADEVNRTIAENANMIRSQIVMETVYGTVTEAEFYNRLKLIEKNFDMIHIVPVIVHTDEKLFKQTDAKEHEYVMLRLCEIIDEKYGELCNCICAKISYNSICALVDCREFDTVRKITEAVADCFKQNGVMKFNIYLGRQRESFEYVSDDCRKMIDLKKYEFLYGFGNILTLEQLEKREEHKGNTSASVYSEKLKQYLAAGDFIACKNMAGTLYRECIGSEYCYSYVDGCFLSLLTTAARFARETVGKDDLKNLELMSDDFSTLEDVYERLEQLFELCGSKTRNTEISAEEKLIEQIKRYVLDNIETDVSQSSVAEYFNISSAHLSRVFKKVTDERFSDFVTGAKLDYAAGLLLNEPDTPVVNIAERLGYYSINYFNSLFKKKFYKTPVQYRKSN